MNLEPPKGLSHAVVQGHLKNIFKLSPKGRIGMRKAVAQEVARRYLRLKNCTDDELHWLHKVLTPPPKTPWYKRILPNKENL